MPLNNAALQVALTTVPSDTYAAITVGHVEAGLVRKDDISPLGTPQTVFTCPLQPEELVLSGQWQST